MEVAAPITFSKDYLTDELRGFYEALMAGAKHLNIAMVRLVTPDIAATPRLGARPGRSVIVFQDSDHAPDAPAVQNEFDRPDMKFFHEISNPLTISYWQGTLEFDVAGRTIAAPMDFVRPDAEHSPGPDLELIALLCETNLDALLTGQQRREAIVQNAAKRFGETLQDLVVPRRASSPYRPAGTDTGSERHAAP